MRPESHSLADLVRKYGEQGKGVGSELWMFAFKLNSPALPKEQVCEAWDSELMHSRR